MKDNFLERMQNRLVASGQKGRNDLEMHDARVIETGNAVRVLATYSELYGPPSVHDIQAWVANRMGAFASQVTARLDTVQAYPEKNFITFVIEQRRLRQPLSATALMVKAGPDTFLDNDNQLWEVVKADEGPNYIVRKETTSIEEMLKVRREALRGGASARKHVTLASVDSIPSAGGGYASMDLGDVVDFYHNGQLHRGKVQSAGAAGIRVSSLTSGDTFTVDPAAITSVVEKSPAATKEQDDIMRRYWSHVYPGNPAMTEIISPSSSKPVQDNRPPPGGEPLQNIEVVASARGVSASVRPTERVPGKPSPSARVEKRVSGIAPAKRN